MSISSKSRYAYSTQVFKRDFILLEAGWSYIMTTFPLLHRIISRSPNYLVYCHQAVAWRVPKAENLRSSSQFSFLKYFLHRTGKIINNIIWIGIGRSNENWKRKYQMLTQNIQHTGVSGDVIKWSKSRKTEVLDM